MTIERRSEAARTVFVRLLNEAVDVWRPVDAEHVRDEVWRLTDQPYDRSLEAWEFEPGDLVVCRDIEGDRAPIFAAVTRVNDWVADAAPRAAAGSSLGAPCSS